MLGFGMRSAWPQGLPLQTLTFGTIVCGGEVIDYVAVADTPNIVDVPADVELQGGERLVQIAS